MTRQRAQTLDTLHQRFEDRCLYCETSWPCHPKQEAWQVLGRGWRRALRQWIK